MLFLTTLSALLAFSPTGALALWPQPRQITTGTTPLRLASDFTIQLNGFRQARTPADLHEAVARTQKLLKDDKLQLLVPDRGASLKDSVTRSRALRSLAVSLTPTASAVVKSIAEEAVAPIGTRSEGYTLRVPADGSEATLTANSTLGLFRGLTTFTQLWYDLDGTTYTNKAPIAITDSPAYPYRGFMLDTSRNYFPISDIKRTLDAMSWTKINTFHWHIVDSHSFPLVVPGFENLSRQGSYSKTSIYTAADVKDIVSYAGARGIDVLVEVDTPGHTSVIHHTHPEHIACFEASPWTRYANEPPAGQLRLAAPATVNFTASLLTSVAKLFPSTLFSTGGDEINVNCYADDAATQEELRKQGKSLEQALDTFTQVTHKALHDIGKTTVVWQEMVLSHQVKLRQDTIALVWISAADAKKVAQRGHRFVHASNEYFYLDCGGGGWVGNHPTGNSWCDPFKTWQKAYSFNPVENLTADEAKLVLGGQQLLWAEQSGPENLDNVVWPRAAASAEVFWSGPGGNVGTALTRLHDLAYRYNKRGVKAIPLQPQWCALRDRACDLDA